MTEPLRIAVADDEPDMRDYYNRMLPRLGHRVIATCADGADLVDRCRELHPDLVITDVRMPDMDGLEAVARITLNEPTPAILVSAYVDADLIRRVNGDGPDGGPIMGVLVKPIKQADLAPAITQAVRRFRRQQLLRETAEGA